MPEVPAIEKELNKWSIVSVGAEHRNQGRNISQRVELKMENVPCTNAIKNIVTPEMPAIVQ